MPNVGFGDDSIESHFRMLATFRAWISETVVLIEVWRPLYNAIRPHSSSCLQRASSASAC